MQSVGEAMAIGRTFPEALQKALRSLEAGRAGLDADPGEAPADGDGRRRPRSTPSPPPAPTGSSHVAEALRRGVTVEEVAMLSGYDPWFVEEMAAIIGMRPRLAASGSPTG